MFTNLMNICSLCKKLFIYLNYAFSAFYLIDFYGNQGSVNEEEADTRRVNQCIESILKFQGFIHHILQAVEVFSS